MHFGENQLSLRSIGISPDYPQLRSELSNPGRPITHSVLYPRNETDHAAPQCISGRTSYLCVRLAFHQTTHSSDRSSVTREGPSPIQCSTPVTKRITLHLNAFRGEPAISAFDWHFTRLPTAQIGAQ